MFNKIYADHISKLEESGLLRNKATKADNLRISFLDNNCLYLQNDAQIIAAANNYTSTLGTGSGGSRLVIDKTNGNAANLESMIAKTYNKDSSTIFSSGYQLNSSVIPALLNSKILKEKALVINDKLNHNSIYAGCMSSDAQMIRYKHLNMEHLDEQLTKYGGKYKYKLIISETLFSMDGDSPNIESMINIAKKHNAMIYLDDSHGIGVAGEGGLGLAHKYRDNIDIIMGSFGKALCSMGAYICCNNIINQYIVNTCGGLKYSTALPPAVIGANIATWQAVASSADKRQHIQNLSQYLKEQMHSRGYLNHSNSHIQPIIIGCPHKTMHITQKLHERGIAVAGIRPPSCNPGTSRLRLIINTNHTTDNINEFLSAFDEITNELQ